MTEVAGDPQAISRFIRAAEDLGYEHLMAYDHVVRGPQDGREPKLAGPYTDKHSFHDPFVLFAYASAVTDKLELVTGVLVLPQRQTALVAQQSADVDLLSRERLRLGVGIGWNHVEYQALGQDFHTRGKRMEEQVGLLRRLWTTPVVTFDGRFDKIDRAGINPRPRRQITALAGRQFGSRPTRAARGWGTASSLPARVPAGWSNGHASGTILAGPADRRTAMGASFSPFSPATRRRRPTTSGCGVMRAARMAVCRRWKRDWVVISMRISITWPR